MKEKNELIPAEIVKFTREKFEELYNLNISKLVDKVKISESRSLTYLSWSQGYKLMKEQDPDSKMEFIINPESKNYLFKQEVEKTSLEIFDEVTEQKIKEEIYVTEIVQDPKDSTKTIEKVVRSKDKEIKITTTTTTTTKKEYVTKKITTYYVKTKVTMFNLELEMTLPVMDAKHNSIESPTTRDTSDSLMRCFAKNLSLFGIGLPLYNKEDLEKFGVTIDDNSKIHKDFIMETYRNNKNPNIVRALQDYSAKNGMIKDLSEQKLEELANILKGLGA